VQVKNGVCQTKSNTPALSFNRFTSGALRKMWAIISNDLDDPTLKEVGPKAMDHLRFITEQFYLNKCMKNMVVLIKAVGKNFIANKDQDNKSEMSVFSSGDEQLGSENEEKDQVDKTTDPNARGLNPVQLQLVLKHFPMKGVKPSSVTATGCNKAVKSLQAQELFIQ
jgi:hypothetical protein